MDAGTLGAERSGLICNSGAVTLIQQIQFGLLSSAAQARRTARYKLRPVGYTSDADFYIYSNHYKQGTTESDRKRRNIEATALRDNADDLGPNVPVIYARDYNIRSSGENMYQTLLGSGLGQVFDPIDQPRAWHENNSFRSTHTQSHADNMASNITRGGVDDRFDFQLMTAALLDSSGVSYLPGSYHVFGNNSSHPLNAAINHPNNTAQPEQVLDALAQVTDHLPVVADYQIPSLMKVDLPTIPEFILQGADVVLDVAVSNAAPVTSPLEADDLACNIQGIVALSGTYSGVAPALTNGKIHRIAMDTSGVGPKLGSWKSVPSVSPSRWVAFAIL